MRKITKDAVRAFEQHKKFKRGNTTVEVSESKLFAELKLHGNTIAKSGVFEGLMISSAGWNTVTTKERLNGLEGVNIHQKDFTWYLNGREWNGAWVDVGTWNLLDKFPNKTYNYSMHYLN
tara:strand:- start:418 stop:777 length:360 start_codon:yes stop_codon:yes gene_type:complete